MRSWLHLQRRRRAPPPRGPNLIGTPPAAECQRALLTNSPPLVRFALSPTQPRELLSCAHTRTFYDVRYAVTRGPGKERNAPRQEKGESVFAIKVYIREEGKRGRYWIIDERLTGLYPLIGNPFGEALVFGFFFPEKHKHGARARPVLIFFLSWQARAAASVYANRDLGDTPETVPCLSFASARRGCTHLKSKRRTLLWCAR